MPSDAEIKSTVMKRGLSTVYKGYGSLSIQGEWVKGKTSGGCFPNFISWRDNEQYRISLKATSVECTCFAQLSWIDPSGKDTKEHPAFGLFVFRNCGPSQNIVQIGPDNLVGGSLFVTNDDVQVEFKTQPSSPTLQEYLKNPSECSDFPVHYTVVPMLFNPEQTGKYLLTIHSGADINVVRVLERERWSQQIVPGEWKGASAGGCKNHSTFSQNPQFSLSFQERQLVQIILRQEQNEKVPAPNNLGAIGFYVKSKDGVIIAKAPFAVEQEVMCTVEIDTKDGPYCIIPCTFDPGYEAEFSMLVSAPGEVALTQV
jgi:hypothetical protein